MERVTSYPYPLSQIVNLLPDLTLAQLLTVKVEAAAAEAKLRARLNACTDRDRERRHELLRRHYAKGGEPLKVVPADDESRDWSAPYEEEAVRQGQDGPDPVYAVSPRFGGVEARAVPADPFEGFPDLPLGQPPEAFDALAPVHAIQAGEAALADLDPDEPIPFVLSDPDDDDPEDTPLVVPPFTDEQEGE